MSIHTQTRRLARLEGTKKHCSYVARFSWEEQQLPEAKFDVLIKGRMLEQSALTGQRYFAVLPNVCASTDEWTAQYGKMVTR